LISGSIFLVAAVFLWYDSVSRVGTFSWATRDCRKVLSSPYQGS
jgi:hypothetical protein